MKKDLMNSKYSQVYSWAMLCTSTILGVQKWHINDMCEAVDCIKPEDMRIFPSSFLSRYYKIRIVNCFTELFLPPTIIHQYLFRD